MSSTTTESGLPEVDNVMKEDMIANALVWLSSRLCNFIAEGESFNPIPAGDRSETPRDDEPSDFGVSQKYLTERWRSFSHEFDVWFEGLPATFKPTARIKCPRNMNPDRDTPDNRTFFEAWYTNGMCGASMLHYHMARILLLINKPHETTARRCTIGNRLQSYRLIEEDIVSHCYEIWYVAMFY